MNQLRDQGRGSLFEDNAKAAGVANTRPDGRNNDRRSGLAFAYMDGYSNLDIFLTNGWYEPFLGHLVWQAPSARASYAWISITLATRTSASLLAGPIAANRPGETSVIRQPELR